MVAVCRARVCAMWASTVTTARQPGSRRGTRARARALDMADARWTAHARALRALPAPRVAYSSTTTSPRLGSLPQPHSPSSARPPQLHHRCSPPRDHLRLWHRAPSAALVTARATTPVDSASVSPGTMASRASASHSRHRVRQTAVGTALAPEATDAHAALPSTIAGKGKPARLSLSRKGAHTGAQVTGPASCIGLRSLLAGWATALVGMAMRVPTARLPSHAPLGAMAAATASGDDASASEAGKGARVRHRGVPATALDTGDVCRLWALGRSVHASALVAGRALPATCGGRTAPTTALATGSVSTAAARAMMALSVTRVGSGAVAPPQRASASRSATSRAGLSCAMPTARASAAAPKARCSAPATTATVVHDV
jgi:hypothetical protein